ncbi:hypothetical protein TKWG_10385 [Advenella kashmirensis WT001]|uniref:Lipoprotein n=1 Tax=Advenella kashmirensis (strain DSM 17095 / LMG 22695 / WT001) TaxID=1036672 RepID=I3UBF5_ADVKW|nr:hypothetical protein [Advenella kashmirensis]AFK62343.1 hypothetical protein TKWG_10385 [Advenella kashmirensis WT001]
MKLSRKVALIVLPLAAVLAGCNSMKTGTESSPGTAQTPAAKGTAVDVFLASDKVIKSYRPVKLSEKQTIYVSKTPIITRANLTSVDRVRDSQGRSFVKLSLNPAGVAALNAAPKEQGYATTVGGQLASLTGIRQNNDFLFMVRDDQVAGSVVEAIAPKTAAK